MTERTNLGPVLRRDSLDVLLRIEIACAPAARSQVCVAHLVLRLFSFTINHFSRVLFGFAVV